MERLSEEEIIDSIKKYLENPNENYALMIDGEWGSGKTYFIKNKVMQIYENEEKKQKRFIYISTYGVKNSSELDSRIYDAIIKEFLPEKIGKVYDIAEKGIASIYEIVAMFKELPNIPKSSIRNLIEIIQKQKEKKYILVFDDIERCDMPTNELLGYINEYVEHKDMKVIVVANEKELSKKKIHSNIELKYMVAKETNLNIPVKIRKDTLSFYEKKDTKEESVEKLGIDELDERVEKLFGEDILYNQVKEKLIGMTICYRPNLEEVTEKLIEKQIKDCETKQYLIEHVKRIISILYNKNHVNIRTLKFILCKLDEIFPIVLKLDLTQYEEKLFKECKYQLLSYIVHKCIEYKEGNNKGKWLEKSEFTYTGTEIFNEYIASFKFVDDFISNGNLNEDRIRDVVTLYVEEKSRESSDYDDPLKVLEHYWELEDEIIEENLNLIELKIKKDGYDKKLYSRIILILVKVVNMGFDNEILEKIAILMRENIDKTGFYGELDEFSIMFNDEKEAEEYNKAIKPIKEFIYEKTNKEKQIDINNIITLNDGWGNKFADYCMKNKSEFQSKKSFFKIIDIDNLIEVIRKSNTKDISYFRRTLGSMYNFSNIKEYYASDIENLNKLLTLLNQIEEDEFKNYGKSKKYNIDSLKESLEEKIKRLQ